jgi:hypothetical protein
VGHGDDVLGKALRERREKVVGENGNESTRAQLREIRTGEWIGLDSSQINVYCMKNLGLICLKLDAAPYKRLPL